MPEPRVTVIGEALVDLIVRPDGSVRVVAGGGPFNAARALRRLGIATSFLGRISDDLFGQGLRSLLEGDGVDLPLPPSVAPTTLAIAHLDEQGGATYGFYLAGTAAPDVTPAQARAELELPPDVLHVGTLGLVIEPLAEASAAAVSYVPRETLVFCDVNVRPAAITDVSAYRSRLRTILARADIVKLSTEDVEHLGLDPSRPRDLLERDDQVVLLTAAAGAVTVLTSAGATSVPVPTVTVVDTVGAGDAFGAGVLASLLGSTADQRDRDAMLAAVDYGAKVAALTCERAGADPPTAAEVALRFA